MGRASGLRALLTPVCDELGGFVPHLDGALGAALTPHLPLSLCLSLCRQLKPWELHFHHSEGATSARWLVGRVMGQPLCRGSGQPRSELVSKVQRGPQGFYPILGYVSPSPSVPSPSYRRQ